jgi:serine/threonine-protein phosphatase 2A activator
LDDHSFLPYIFGSAQLSPAITSPADIVTEGSLPGAPDPGDVAKSNIVQRERQENMYFSAIGFIYDVKKGPFWEHSPILFDISGVKAGWAKINKVNDNRPQEAVQQLVLTFPGNVEDVQRGGVVKVSRRAALPNGFTVCMGEGPCCC